MTAPAKDTTPGVDLDATQYVCDPTRVAVCKCASDDGDLAEFTCACESEPNISGDCPTCLSPMVLINVDTGEPVEAKAS